MERVEPIKLDGGRRIESRKGVWVVAGRLGGFLASVDDQSRTYWEGDEDFPPQKFATLREALLA